MHFLTSFSFNYNTAFDGNFGAYTFSLEAFIFECQQHKLLTHNAEYLNVNIKLLCYNPFKWILCIYAEDAPKESCCGVYTFMSISHRVKALYYLVWIYFYFFHSFRAKLSNKNIFITVRILIFISTLLFKEKFYDFSIRIRKQNVPWLYWFIKNIMYQNNISKYFQKTHHESIILHDISRVFI